jgi:hypothetical protein
LFRNEGRKFQTSAFKILGRKLKCSKNQERGTDGFLLGEKGVLRRKMQGGQGWTQENDLDKVLLT